MKKITYLLTVFIVLLSLAGLTGLKAEGSDMTQVAVISVTKIGGLRNTNNLVVYFAKDYPDGSNQNQWGYEAAVNSEGVVVELGVNVRMPSGGFIISGHGTALTTVQNTLKIGQYVEFNQDQMKLYIYEDQAFSYYYGAKSNLANANQRVTNQVEAMYDIDLPRIQNLQNEAKALLSDLEAAYTLYQNNQSPSALNILKEKANLINSLSQDIIYLSYPNFKIEGRALWHRPNSGKGYDELTLEGVQKMLDQMKKMGIQTIMVETFWEGFVCYQSEYLPYQPQMKKNGVVPTYGEYGKDYLKSLIGEAKKRGIEVHAWTETFLAGVSGSGQVGLSSHIKQEWLNVNYFGVAGESSEGATLYYYDPANPELRTLLTNAYRELAKKYDLDAIELDYIRYPYSNLVNFKNGQSTSNINDSGYTAYAMNDFMTSYGYTGDMKQLIATSAKARTDWIRYRTQKVTESVMVFRKAILEEKPNMKITIAVAADYQQGINNYCQNWTEWSKNGWIDSVKPMAYTADSNYVGNLTQIYLDLVGSMSLVYAGIGPVYLGYPVSSNQDQMTIAVLKGGAGSAIFASHNILGNKEFERALELSASYISRLSPESDPQTLLTEGLNYLLDKMDRIYNRDSEFNNIDAIKAILTKAKTTELTPVVGYEKVVEELDKAILELSETTDATIRQRMYEDLSYMRRLFDYLISRTLIKSGDWIPTINPNRPSGISVKLPDPPAEGPKGCGFQSDIALLFGILALPTLAYFVFRKRHAI